MNIRSYISPKTEVKESKIEGSGLFAREEIKKDEIFGIKAGHVISAKELEKIGGLHSEVGKTMLQISEEFFIGPLSQEEVSESMIHVNHSCVPNGGMFGNIIFVAMRDIHPGEECTADYGMLYDDEQYHFACKCGQPKCRKRVTGSDWKREELQKEYEGYFATYIQRKIERAMSRGMEKI